MSRLIKSIFVVLLTAVLFTSSSAAQDYSFVLEEQSVNVYFEGDGTISIDYIFKFQNNALGAPIDFVDIGLPNNDFDLSSISANINDLPITDIDYSPYVTYGFALDLGIDSIQPGDSGTIVVNIPSIQNPYYFDSQDENYASFQFSPTWFDPAFVTGSTYLDITFHLPLYVQPDEPRWHQSPDGFPEEPETGIDDSGRVFYRWVNPSANGFTQYIFGTSIPRKYVLPTFLLVSEDVNIFMENSGQVHVDYQIEIVNESINNDLTNLYIALPSWDYSVTNLEATFNDQPVYIFDEYEKTNITFYDNPLAANQSGVVTFAYDIVDLVYSSSWYDDKYALATLIFSPGIPFSPFYVGPESFAMTFHLPDELSAHDISYNASPNLSAQPETGNDASGRNTITWFGTDLAGNTNLETEIQIPREFISESAIYDYPKPPLHSRLGISDDAWFGSIIIGGIILLITVAVVIILKVDRSRKLKYLPPKLRIEGHGIKRGLTAVEAAVLMENPVDRVFTMILFSVLKKNAASVITNDPLKLEATKPIPTGLRKYETAFLDAFEETSKKTQKKELQSMFISLVREISKKMKGFSRKETIKYYRNIMEKAWAEVEAAGTPEVKSQKFDEYLGWTMLDKDFNKRTSETFESSPIILPRWWQRYNPPFSSSSRSIGAETKSAIPTTSHSKVPPVSSRTSPALPSLPGSDFAATVVQGTQNFSNNVIGDIVSFTSGVTNRTNPVPKSTSSSGKSKGGSFRSSGGGGSSCACACACACAGCACACAGGGR